ncbi:hypothetical protein D3C84_964640 [compost metagenome]
MSSYAKTNVVNISRGLSVIDKPGDLAFLYIPVNSLGMAVEPKRALRLECWKHTGIRREILYVADSLKYAMVRKDHEAHLHLFGPTFELMDSNDGIEWLTQIHRHVEGDIHLPKFQFVVPSAN